LVGDLKYGRTVHSLLMAMSRYNPVFNFISHEKLRIPDEYKMYLNNIGIKYYEHSEFEKIQYADILYMTRVQKERFSDPMEYEKTKDTYILKNDMLNDTKDNLRILHPLPRVTEVDNDVDENRKAYYFDQALNGVFTRQAIISSILDIKPENDTN